jgi:hypothetical protein
MSAVEKDEYQQLENEIIDLEKLLLLTAPEEIKKLYLKIDSLWHRQQNLIKTY